MLRVLNEEKGFVVRKKELNNLRHSLGLYFRAPNVSNGRKENADGLVGADEQDESADEEAGEENRGVINDDRSNGEANIGATSPLQKEEFYQTDGMRDLLATIDRPQRFNTCNPTNVAVLPSISQSHKRKRADSSKVHLATTLHASTPSYPAFLAADVAARRAVRDEADTANAAKVASFVLRRQRPHRHPQRQKSAGGSSSKVSGPRYPSEMTLDAVKTLLNLEHDTYRTVRDSFEEICVAKNIARKKGCNTWQTAKDSLIAITPALYSLFNVTINPAPGSFTQAAAAVPTDQQNQALDILCMDVTKQIRNRSVRVSVAESKKVLGLDPARVTTARTALTQRLIANDFVSRTESGEHWKVIRDEWIAEQGLRTDINAMKAADVLCADVMKRFNETRTKLSRRIRTVGVQAAKEKEQNPPVGKAEEKEHAKANAGEEENQGEVEFSGRYISLSTPAFSHHACPPSGYISLPLPLSIMAACSSTAPAAHDPALLSVSVPQQATHTHTSTTASDEGFRNLYPEIDPEIFAIHGYERQA